MMRSFFGTVLLLAASAAGLVAQKTTPFDLIVRESSLPKSLNPITSSGAVAQYIENNIFMGLMEYNPTTLVMEPTLAVTVPKPLPLEKGPFAGGMSLTFEIRPEAQWDNGTPITAHDYLFTVKAVINPLGANGGLRSYYEFIDSLEIDSKNPKKFTIYSKTRYFTALESSGELQILPEYLYDPDKKLRSVPFSHLKDPKKQTELAKNAALRSFTDRFQSSSYDRDPEYILGAGAYRVSEWNDSTQLVLERKTNWWGDAVPNNPLLKAYPTRIIYRVYKKNMEAMKAFQDSKIHVYRDMPPAYFLELQQHPSLSKQYEFSSPVQISYAFIGMNMTNPLLADKRVRRALAHLVDKKMIIDELYNGLAVSTVGPIHPSKSYYNKNLKEIEFSHEKAKQLLAEAGWKDSNGNGIVDKTVDGKLLEMKMSYKYNENNIIRRKIGLMLQHEASKVGIHIDMVEVPWNQFLDDVHDRNVELYSLAWVQGPGLDDMKQIWHSSANDEGGSNRMGFGTPETDKIIEEIRYTLDEAKRNELYMKIQQIIYDEQPYVFLVAPQQRTAISRKLSPSKAGMLNPGYQERLMQLINNQ